MTLRILSIALFVLVCQTGHAEDIARLIAADKGDHLSFFLPITHVGTPVETSGAYLDEVIRVAYKQSTALYDESAILTGPRSWFSDCPREVVDKELDAQLDKVFEEAVEGTVFWDANALFKRKTSRFTKITSILSPPYQRNTPSRSIPKAVLRSAVHNALYIEHPIPKDSIETQDEKFIAYCSIDAEERHAFIRSLISEWDAIKEELRTKAPEDRLNGSDDNYIAYLEIIQSELNGNNSIAPGIQGKSDFSFKLDKLWVWPRNQLWMKKFDRIANTEAIPFYALGAAHFPTLESGKGLIALLREEGYTLSLIKNREELNAILREHYTKKAMRFG